MSYNLLTTDGVNSYVADWNSSQVKKKIDPLTKKKQKWTDLQTAYTTLTDKLNSLKAITYTLSQTGSSSTFLEKKSSSSNTSFADITATSAAAISTQSLRINQLAKNDTAMSLDQTSTAYSTTITGPGTHSITITAGDGEGGVLTSNVDVVFEASDFSGSNITNKAVMEKVQDALGTDKAIVTSNSVTGSTVSAGSFNLNLDGTVTQINYNAGTYSDVMDSIITQVNALSGINAEKVVDGSNVQLKMTVTDSNKYLTIDGDTSGLLSELGVSANKVIGASGLVNATVFSPSNSLSQMSIAAKESGKAYKLLSMSDVSGGQALTAFGLNLGATRTSFVQNLSGIDTPGFIYTEELLNAKIEFNGISVERDSNSISDLITGATNTLNSVMDVDDTTVSLSISSDKDAVIEKIQDFIKKFNEIYLFLREKSKTTDEGAGVLKGDSTSDSLTGLFTSIASSSIPGISTDNINSLSRMGITFSVSEGLSVSDSSRLAKAVKENPSQVEAVFNSTNGVATTLYNRVVPYVNATGYLFAAKENFDVSINYLDDKITDEQTRIDKRTSDLRLRMMKTMSQYNALLNSQSRYIMSNNN